MPLPSSVFERLFLALVLTCLPFGASLAGEEQVLEKAIPRRILALYDDTTYSDPYYSLIHQNAEMPLNYLGLEVVYHPSRGPFPSAAELTGVRGILYWYDGRPSSAERAALCTFLSEQIDEGRKVVVLGGLERIKLANQKLQPACDRAFRQLGARFLGEFADNPYFFEVSQKDADMVEFERKLVPTEDLEYSHVVWQADAVRTYLTVRRIDMEDSESAMVFTSPAGGFAHFSYIQYANKFIEKKHWRLNPFRFFEEAFAVQGLPRPDTTTLNGRRLFFSHIDGDGIFNISHIDRKTFSGEIILTRILKAYADVPITVSLITGYEDLVSFSGERAHTLYRDIFSLPNVEPAAHGYAHPLIWAKKTLALNIPGYDYDPRREVVGSVEDMRVILKRAGVDKPVVLFQWTGDCVPDLSAAALPEKSDLLNLNGGDTRFDATADSVGHVSPLGLKRGPFRQIYAAAANENIFTNLWEGPYFGFRQVIDTFKNTDTPRRLKPINLYYHFYSGERNESFTVLKEAYDFALSQKIIAVRASDYVRISMDFFSYEIFATADGGFRVAHDGLLRTLRFDGESRTPDLKKSRGVMGFSRHGKDLYIHLNEGRSHTVYLTDELPGLPYVSEANFWIEGFKAAQDEVRFDKRGWRAGEITLAGMAPNKGFRILANNVTLHLKSDQNGGLSIVFDDFEGDGDETHVTLTRED